MEEEWRPIKGYEYYEVIACHKSYKGFLWDFKEKESIQDNINKSFNI